jgi:hypothetical protein
VKKVYLLIGAPASGKTYVTDRMKGSFELVDHDAFIGRAKQPEAYVSAILAAAKDGRRDVLAEAPFSISQIKDPLESAGLTVVPVFVTASDGDLHSRWDQRGNVSESTRRGHMTRLRTYAERARDWNAFRGTSDEVLEFLRAAVSDDARPFGQLERALDSGDPDAGGAPPTPPKQGGSGEATP